MREVPSRFAELLRSHRITASLSQEALAEAAQISVAAVSAYERGLRRAPHPATVRLLAEALHLQAGTWAEFEVAARRTPRRKVEEGQGEVRRDNLPSPVTSFLGRAAEVNGISELLRRHRIVTLIGSGGIGKTRLALQTAWQVRSEYPDGLWFIDFSTIAEEPLVILLVALVLGIRVSGSESGVESLIAQFTNRRQLLIFDNCEHLVKPIADLAAAILRNTTTTTILATSRERLRITGEAVSRVSTLPFPTAGPLTPTVAQSFPAVKLFIERAQAAVPEFTLSSARVDAVAAICRRLEGIPLAIELAAARLPSLSLAEIRDKLSDRFAALSIGQRDRPLRQQTLLATIAWSYDLLDERERSVLKALSTFPASFRLDAGVAVCDRTLTDEAVTVDLISSLADKSLLTVEPFDDETDRYVMLDSTRDYVRRSRRGEELEIDALRFAEWCASFAETCERSRFTISTEVWADTIRPEFESMLAGLDWALRDVSRAVVAGRILAGSRAYWVLIGRADELAELARDLLTKISAAEYPSLTARLIFCRYNTTSRDERKTRLLHARKLLENTADQHSLMICNLFLADCLSYAEPIEALRAADEAERLAKALHLPRVLLSSSEVRITVLGRTNRHVEAKEAVVELLRRRNALSEVTGVGRTKLILAAIESELGNPARAAQIAREVVAMGSQVTANEQGHARSCLSQYLAMLGEDEEARSVARGVLLDPALLSQRDLPRVILSIAVVSARQGQALSAARLFGFCQANYLSEFESSGGAQKCRDMLMPLLLAALSSAKIDAYIGAGRGLSNEAAIEEALTR